MTIQHGSTLKFAEIPEGDYSGVVGLPEAWIIEADGKDPKAGAAQIALTVIWDTDRWIATLADTTGLIIGNYYVYTRYTLSSGETYIPEPTSLIVKG